MPTQNNFGFCGPTYQALSPVLDAERCINLYPETAESGKPKQQIALVGTPGLSPINAGTPLPGQVRALWAGNGRLFAISSNHGYEVSPSSGAIITDYGAMTGDPGGATSFGYPCQISANFGGNSNQLFVHNSYSEQIYQFNTTGPAMTQILTNGTNVGATAIEYLDGFTVAILGGAALPSATQPNAIAVSNFGDGTTWQPLNYVVMAGYPQLYTQLKVINGQLWIFGQKAIEVWYDAGNPLFPFVRYQGATIDHGLLAPFSVAKIAGTVMWLGADERGSARVYMANGFNAIRVSTPGIEAIINGVNAPQVVSFSTTAFPYEENGHSFYVLNLPSNGLSSGASLVYDTETKLWHERYYNNSGAFATPRPWCFACVSSLQGASPLQADNFVGDYYSTGLIYRMSTAITSDNNVAIIRQRTAPHVANSNRFLKHKSLEIDADIGTAQLKLAYCNDGARAGTFPISFGPVSASTNDSSPAGAAAFGRFKFYQLGRSRDRVYQVTITDANNPIRLIGAYLDAEQGTED
jgi:hypothetical protein